MEDFLTPVSTTYLKPRDVEVGYARPDADTRSSPQSISTPQQALEALRSQPDYEQLLLALRYLHKPGSAFSIWTPSPDSGQIVSVLAGEIAQNYWTLLSETTNQDQGDIELFLPCLLSITGLNSLVTKLRALAGEAKGVGQSGPVRQDIATDLALYLDLTARLLQSHHALEKLWENMTGTASASEATKKQLLSELVGLVAGGRLLSTAAEAEHLVQTREGRDSSWWVANGVRYNIWLGKNVASWGSGSKDMNLAGTAWARGLRLGYADALSKAVIDELLLSKSASATAFSNLLDTVPALDQKKILAALVSHLAGRFLDTIAYNDTSPNKTVSAVAGLLKRAVGDDAARKACLVAWLTSSTGAGIGEGIAVRRAVVAAVGDLKDTVLSVVEGAIGLLGDELYIRHSPALQQEAHVQVLLLAVSHLNRLAPLKLISLVKTGGYLSTISNRIAASQARSRFLGMIVGEALSAIVDGERRQLKFGLPELETEEAAWWKGLVNVQDHAGDVDALLVEKEDAPEETITAKAVQPTRTMVPKPVKPRNIPEPGTKAQPKPMIQIIDSDGEDSEGEEDDDLKPYAKPSFDPEDSDEDPTLITRNRAQPPVYIRTLLTYFRASEDVDKQTLALQHAPRLIRSKAHHGAEVSSHAIELASQLIGLTDSFSIDDFIDMRLRGLVALVVAAPADMGPWMARSLWEGDFNVTQRVSLMIALGLGGREVAGQQQPDEGEKTSWVGERLPEKMERLYLEEAPQSIATRGSSLKPIGRNAIDMAAHDITSAFLAPLAAKAADESAGPDSLKLATFKSKVKSKTGGAKIKAIPNTTSALIYNSFFSPLHARLTYSLSRRQPIMHMPSVLTTYIKTLGLLIYASGPSTLSLPQMTAELWDLLLALRSKSAGDIGVTSAILGALVALLEVNDISGPGARRLCNDFGKQVVETREWSAMVFGQVRGEGEEEEKEVKALAAGVLVRLDEMLEKYRLLLMGTLM